MIYDQTTIRTLNSMTKYPSIATYHPLGDKGILQPGPPFFEGTVALTEKIDGTNARIILMDDGYFIGSREELLHYGTDVIFNPAQGIVEAIDITAEKVWDQWYADNMDRHALTIVYGEVFGGKGLPASKQYTTNGFWGFRVFDVVHYTGANHIEVANWPLDKISAWRESGGLPMYNWIQVKDFCRHYHLNFVPIFGRLDALKLPRTIEDTQAWMIDYGMTESLAQIDLDAGGRCEGIVIREEAGHLKRKLRFEDYAKALRVYSKEAAK